MQEQPIRILYCTDFSENAGRAFAYALEAAALRKGSELHLIHVIPEPDAQYWKSYIYGAEGDADDKAKNDIDEKIDREYGLNIGELFNELPLGEGKVDWDRYLAALSEIGYRGYLTVEREVGANPEADIRTAVNFLKSKI